MENVYRRSVNRTRRRERTLGPDNKMSWFKQLILKQSMICILMLLVASSIKLSPEDSMTFGKNTIKFILTHQTEYEKIPQQVRGFVDKYILNKETENVNNKKALLGLKQPIDSVVESPFGMRMHPVEKVNKFHYGVDLRANEGDKIACAQDGIAEKVSSDGEYGNYIIVKHEDNISSLYGHCESILAAEGDEIKGGQVIALAGKTGNTTGTCLHFELRDGDNWLDPAEFINFKKE